MYTLFYNITKDTEIETEGVRSFASVYEALEAYRLIEERETENVTSFITHVTITDPKDQTVWETRGENMRQAA